MKEIEPLLGRRIKFFRKKAGLTINQLAELANMDGGFLNYVENGKKSPSLNTISRLSKSLNIPVKEFFSDTVLSAQDAQTLNLVSQVRTVFYGKTKEQQKKIYSVLKALKNPDTLNAIYKILKH